MARPKYDDTVLPKRLVNKAATKTPASKYDKGSVIPKVDARSYAKSIDDLRTSGDTLTAVRELARVDGTVASAVHSFIQIANSGINLAAYDTTTHQFNPEATQAATSILAAFNTLHDYSKGYSNKKSVDAVVETLLNETLLTGGCGLELILNKQYLPDRLEPVSLSQIDWVAKGENEVYPQQKAGGGEPIPLDIPTFFIGQSRQDPTTAYARSMLEPALTSVFMFDEFVEDVRKVIRQSGHSRLTLKLDAAKVKASAPPETQNDATKLATYLDNVRSQAETLLSDLAPEDALVFYDSAEADLLSSQVGGKADYTPLLKSLAGILATSLKVPPSILGLRLEGSQSLSNTESLVFLKVASSLHQPVETVLSRAVTLSVRLLGLNAYVKVRFNNVDFRPTSELEAFRTMHQQRILEQLSLGFITDDEAAFLLKTGPRNPVAPELSGTRFHGTSAIAEKAQEVSPNDDPQGRALQPDTPDSAGGGSK